VLPCRGKFVKNDVRLLEYRKLKICILFLRKKTMENELHSILDVEPLITKRKDLIKKKKKNIKKKKNYKKKKKKKN